MVGHPPHISVTAWLPGPPPHDTPRPPNSPLAPSATYALPATLTGVSELEKRSGYMPRRARERRAYQLAVGGAVAGAVGVVGIVLAITGVVGAGLPIIALIVAALCVLGFMRTVAAR